MIKPIIIDGEKTNYTISDEGIVFNLKTNREVKGTTKRNEYKRNGLYWKYNRYKPFDFCLGLRLNYYVSF